MSFHGARSPSNLPSVIIVLHETPKLQSWSPGSHSMTSQKQRHTNPGLRTDPPRGQRSTRRDTITPVHSHTPHTCTHPPSATSVHLADIPTYNGTGGRVSHSVREARPCGAHESRALGKGPRAERLPARRPSLATALSSLSLYPDPFLRALPSLSSLARSPTDLPP